MFLTHPRWRSRRRLAAMCVLIFVLLLTGWLTLRPRARRPAAGTSDSPPEQAASPSPGPLYAPPGGGEGDRQANPDRTSGVPLDLLPLPQPEPEKPVAPEPPPEPSPEPPPELAGLPSPPSASSDSAPPGGASASADDALALQPRVYVHPRVPVKLVLRRKIDDAVVLQVLVGGDGRVHDVKVLHAIPNCEECTESAVEAARQFVYDPPVLSGGATALWTRPFDMRFSYRR